MSAGPPISAPPSFPPPVSLSRLAASKGFSLVEVVMAIGIIAFAFVALFGLLPTGLKVFRESVDGANETWILQSLNSMAQVTEWSKLPKLGHEQGGDIYYFDEEGRLTDTELRPGDAKAQERRLYAAKLLVEEFVSPQEAGGRAVQRSARRVIAVLASYPNPGAMKTFQEIRSAADLKKGTGHFAVRCRSFLVAQMESGLR